MELACPICGTQLQTKSTQPREDNSGTEQHLPSQWAAEFLAPGTRFGDYELIAEIGRGGMGVVWRVFDVHIRRPLAVKFMLGASLAGNDRFLEEARITGQLQHPGIPPVHEIGHLEGGQPFFAMKLIEGRTFAELLGARATPQSDLPRFLKVFEQIAQTLGYAHSQGVIHRDLKPSNVMVGEFGEVQVMDWGLARRLSSKAAKASQKYHASSSDLNANDCPGTEVKCELPAGLAETLSVSPGTAADHAPQYGGQCPAFDRLTEMGQVLGTPACMPPEQARGRIDAMDERADVFGLGAILCVVLTGRPPYVGRDGSETLRLAQQAELGDAFERLAACGADEELIALARACLAAEPAARPPNAGDVAAKVTSYLESAEARRRQAELDRAQVQLRIQEERKRWQLTMALSLTGALAIAVVAGSWIWFRNRFETQETERRQSVLAALDKVDDLTAQSRWQEAELILEQAEERFGEAGPNALRQRLEQARRETRLLTDLDEARMARSQATRGTYLEPGASATAYERAFAKFGIDVIQKDVAETASRLLQLRPALRNAVVLALDDWASCSEDKAVRAQLRRVANLADSEPWRKRLRQTSDRMALEALADEALRSDTEPLPAVSLALLSAELRAEGAPATALRVLRHAVRSHPADFWAHHELAVLMGMGDWRPVEVIEEQIGHYRAALAIRPHAAPVLNNLAAILLQKRDVEGAIVACRRAIELDGKLVLAYNTLGNALRANQDTEGALAAYRQAIALDPSYADPHNNLGVVLRAKGDRDGAIAAFRKAIAINPKYAASRYELGKALEHAGDLEGAIAAYRKAVELSPTYPPAHSALGWALRTKGDADGALIAYRRAVELSPKDADAHIDVGIALAGKQDLDAAIASFRRAIELDARSARAHYSLGNALKDRGDVDGSIVAYRKTIELDADYASAYINLGLVLDEAGDSTGAIAAFRRATELQPQNAMAHCNLGRGLLSQGDFAAALAAVRIGHELGSKQRDWRFPSAQLVRQVERMVDLDTRLPALLKGEIQPADSVERLGFASVCQFRELHLSAARLCADAFTVEPELADDLNAMNRFNAACSAALAGCGKGKDARELDDTQRLGWRKQALEWLRADLNARATALQRRPQENVTTARMMAQWQTTPALLGVHEESGLQELPVDERAAWRELWADIRQLRRQAEAGVKAANP